MKNIFACFFVLYNLSELFLESRAWLVLLHTGVEVSHPYRSRYLTHTPNGVSLIDLLYCFCLVNSTFINTFKRH